MGHRYIDDEVIGRQWCLRAWRSLRHWPRVSDRTATPTCTAQSPPSLMGYYRRRRWASLSLVVRQLARRERL